MGQSSQHLTWEARVEQRSGDVNEIRPAKRSLVVKRLEIGVELDLDR